MMSRPLVAMVLREPALFLNPLPRVRIRTIEVFDQVTHGGDAHPSIRRPHLRCTNHICANHLIRSTHSCGRSPCPSPRSSK